jgi:YVTN family beta-propeller protein
MKAGRIAAGAAVVVAIFLVTGMVTRSPAWAAAAPDAPSGVIARAGYASAAVSWSAPGSDGGSPITGYTVTASPGGATCTTTMLTCILAGLTNDVIYTFTVTATNEAGTSSPSAASTPVTPPIVASSIAVGSQPLGISSDGADVWVGNKGSSSISELDATTGGVMRTIPVYLADAVSSDGTHVWVTQGAPAAGGGYVSEIDAKSGTVMETVDAGTGTPAAVSSDGTDVWVAISNSVTSVSELDAKSVELVRTIAQPGPLGVSSDGTHVWVANGGSNSVTEIDAVSGTVMATVPVGADPEGISSDGAHVWVADHGDNTVAEIDATTGAVVKTVPVGTGPAGVDSDGQHVWVTNQSSNTVSEIDASTGQVIGSPIPVGAGPQGISSDGTHVWVANENDGTVTELATGGAFSSPAPATHPGSAGDRLYREVVTGRLHLYNIRIPLVHRDRIVRRCLLHVRRHGVEPGWRQYPLRGLGSISGSRRSLRPVERRSFSEWNPGDRELVGANQRWWLIDLLLHGDRHSRGTSLYDQHLHELRDLGTELRHQLHVHRHGRECHWYEPALDRFECGRASNRAGRASLGVGGGRK